MCRTSLKSKRAETLSDSSSLPSPCWLTFSESGPEMLCPLSAHSIPKGGGCQIKSDGMKRPVSSGMRYAPNVRRARGTKKRRPAMQKISTMRTSGRKIFNGQLTIGLDLGDRSSSYCVLDEAGKIL